MAGIFVGSSEVSEIYVGSTPVKEVWVGNTKVWPSVVAGPQFSLEARIDSAGGALLPAASDDDFSTFYQEDNQLNATNFWWKMPDMGVGPSTVVTQCNIRVKGGATNTTSSGNCFNTLRLMDGTGSLANLNNAELNASVTIPSNMAYDHTQDGWAKGSNGALPVNPIGNASQDIADFWNNLWVVYNVTQSGGYYDNPGAGRQADARVYECTVELITA